MNEEKTYSVVGQVTIGTDEYRDLIKEVANLKHEYSEANSQRFAAQRERDEAIKRIDALSDKLSLYQKFVQSDPERTSAFMLFEQQKRLEAMSDED